LSFDFLFLPPLLLFLFFQYCEVTSHSMILLYKAPQNKKRGQHSQSRSSVFLHHVVM
jgi:hypothetical protein